MLNSPQASGWKPPPVLDIETHRALGYTLGGNPVVMTVKNGALAVVNSSEQYERV